MYEAAFFIMKLQLHKSRLFWQAIFILILDGLFFGLTDPNKINSIFLIVGFVLFAVSLYVLTQIILDFMIKLGFKMKNRRKIAVFIAVLACLLLALQSIGQLTDRDVLIIVPLAALLYIYATYIRPRTLS